MKGLYTILLLIVSNVFMTFAWYGHLKLQDMKVAALRHNLIFMEYRSCGIFLFGSSQSYRVYW